MKKNNMIRRTLVALTFALAVAVFIPTAGSVEAQAAKKVTAKTNWKKAPRVKTGTTKVTVKKPNVDSLSTGYIKFKAPKKGTYKITISDYKSKGVASENDIEIGYIMIGKKQSGGLVPQTVKTEGGKIMNLSFCTKAALADEYYKNLNKGLKKKNRYLAKRSATIKLKKGETIWIYIASTSSKQNSCTLKIKKK